MAETITMPKLGFDMSEGTLVRWVKQVGEDINKGDVLAEIETDKATVEVESSASGIVLQHIVSQGTVVPVNAPIAVVGQAGEPVQEAAPAKAGPARNAESAAGPARDAQAPAAAIRETTSSMGLPATLEGTPERPADGAIKASPLARKMARDNSIDLGQIHGSGPGGRIVRKDLEAALSAGARPATRPAPVTVPVQAGDEAVPFSRLRQAIGRRMTESTTSVPHFFVTHEFKMDALMELRKQINQYLPENDQLSVNDFIVKAAALALREFPNLNSSFGGDKAVRHGSVNVGVAVAVEGGLLTVVTRNTDQQSLSAISREIKRMAAGAREGRVRPDDIEGSTFSISNLGMYDVESFSAIINPPEAGILAVGSARQVPVVENGEVKPGWRMKATLSVDHRVSDGAEGARFMQALAKYLEVPLRLMV